MPNLKTLGATLFACAALTTATHAQSCASPLTAGEGDTPVATTTGVTLNLSGFCTLGTDGSVYNTSFYRFVASQTATYTVQTCNSVNFDTRIAVLTDCANPSTVLACNDDSTGCYVTGSTLPYASKLTFSATAGTAYYIAVGGYSAADTGSGSMNISSSGGGGGGGGGGGDGCAAAANAADGPNGFDTTGSTENVDITGFCDPGPFGDDLLYGVKWFSYVATFSGNTEVSTCNSAPFDTRLGVFASCDTSSVIACNDDGSGCANFSSSLQFTSVAGTTYYIAVGGYDAASAGAGTVTITPNAAPPESCGNSVNDCCAANATPFCSDSDCCSLVCGADAFCCDTQWDDICAQEASQLCTSCGAGTCDLPAATGTESEACGSDTNGGCNAPVVATEPIAVGNSIGGTFWADANIRDTDWYEFTVNAGTQLDINLYSKGPGRIFLVDNACPPAVLASSPAAGASCPANVNFCVPAGTYRIVALMTLFTGFPCGGDRNDYVLTLNGTPCDASSPPNDECETAIAVATGSVNFDSTFATTSGLPLDPSCDEGFGTNFVKDVWFAWTPATSGIGIASLCNAAAFDTRLAAYTDCFGGIVGCNDDAAGCGLTSEMQFQVSAGTTYLIRVGGYSAGGTGTLTLSVGAALPNDECTGAIAVGNGDTAFDSTTATDSVPPLDPVCDEGFGTAIRKDLWFTYVATCSETVTVSTCGSATFDTRLAIYDACGGTTIACNDDGAGCPNLTSKVTFSATQGTTYVIRLGGFSGGGTGTMNVDCGSGGGGVANDTCTGATVANNGANAFSNIGAVSDAPATSPANCGTAGTGFYNDVWFKWTATQAGTATFSTCGTASFDTRLELWTGCPDAGGTILACNDDGAGCTGFTSLMTATVTCGTQYLVRVGAYGSTGFGTGTLTVTPGATTCAPPCPADLDGNGIVNGADLGIVLGNWGNSGAGDINGDGVVNGADLGAILGAYGTCP